MFVVLFVEYISQMALYQCVSIPSRAFFQLEKFVKNGIGLDFFTYFCHFSRLFNLGDY